MIYVLSGGGSGATLVITGVAGDTCTITKDSKSKSKTFDSSGKATFKGLDTGTWTVTMTSSSGSTATRTVTINADYTLSISYFSATIKVTYPANSKCVIKDSSGTTVASDTNTTSSTKTWTATVGATGTYTITATSTSDSSKTTSTTVSITADGQTETVTLLYELVLFDADNGGDNTTVTGGWNSIEESGGTTTYTQPYSYLYLKNVWRATLYPNNTVDVTKYTKLNVSVKKTGGENSNAWVALTTSKPATNPSESIDVGTGLNIAQYTEQTTAALDISANAGANYIVLYGNFCEMAIYRIWLT